MSRGRPQRDFKNLKATLEYSKLMAEKEASYQRLGISEEEVNAITLRHMQFEQFMILEEGYASRQKKDISKSERALRGDPAYIEPKSLHSEIPQPAWKRKLRP